MSTKGICMKWSDERKERNHLKPELSEEIRDNALCKLNNMSMMLKCEIIDNCDGWDNFKCNRLYNQDRFRSIRTQINFIIYNIIFKEENNKEKYTKRKGRLAFLDKICKQQSEESRQKRKKLNINNRGVA
jgi:hypothetical protein